MSFKLTVSDTVTVPVKGSLSDGKGSFKPFQFTLTCTRLSGSEVEEWLAQGGKFQELMNRVTKGWAGITGDDDEPVPFSVEAAASLFDVMGVAAVAASAYLEQNGAKGKEKN